MIRKKRAWFTEAKFGMFIHFGLYTLHSGNENDFSRNIMSKADYEKTINRFNPKRFDADQWVSLAEDAGARYLVLTSKHGEGFCLWDSQYTGYKITNSPFRRDLAKELSDACHRRKMRFGFYFSCTDWHYEEPGEGKKEAITYPGYFEAQIKELLTGYGQIDCIWFDGGDKRLKPAFIHRMVSLIHRLQPTAVVNDRGVDFHGDYVTPERSIPDTVGRKHAFIECCDAIGQKSWGYHSQQSFWSTPELIRRLSQVASLGGNYLLNVEPMPDGRIRPECVERMLAIGRWLKLNRASVFATQGSPLFPVDAAASQLPRLGFATTGKDSIYLHLHQWPQGDSVLVPHLTGNVKKAEVIGSKKELKTVSSPKELLIEGLPDQPPDQSVTIIKVTFTGQPKVDLKALYSANRNAVHLLPKETVYLQPETAEVRAENGVPRHVINRFPDGVTSLGLLWMFKAEIIWHLLVEKEGHYEVYANLGANEQQKDATFEIEVSGQAIRGKTVFTGGFAKPQRIRVGRVKIPSGRQELRVRILEMPHGWFADIFSLVFQPVS